MRRPWHLLGIGVAVACSSTKAPPPPTGYTLLFPSTDVAVATDTVEVLVFDVPPDQPDLCNTLVLHKRSNQDLGPSLTTSTPKSVCDLAAGTGTVAVSFGVRAFFAIGRQGQNDFLLGCTAQQVAGGTTPPSIYLDYVSDTVRPAPPSPCRSVSQKCTGGC
jgi:hypothetical protein